MFNIPLLKPKVPLTGKLVLTRGADGLFTSYVPVDEREKMRERERERERARAIIQGLDPSPKP